MGHPDYEISSGKISLDGEDLLELEAWERARKESFSLSSTPGCPGSAGRALLEKSVASIRGEDSAKGPCLGRHSSQQWKRSLSPDLSSQDT